MSDPSIKCFCLVVLLSCQWCFASATKRRRADGCDIDGSHQSPMAREMQLVGLYIGGVMYIAKMIGLASGTVMVTGWADTTCSYERVPHDKSISACVALSLQQISGVAITQSTSVPRVHTHYSHPRNPRQWHHWTHDPHKTRGTSPVVRSSSLGAPSPSLKGSPAGVDWLCGVWAHLAYAALDSLSWQTLGCMVQGSA